MSNTDDRKLALYEFIFGNEFDENTYSSIDEAAEAEIEETSWDSFECDGGEYVVLDDGEADDRAKQGVIDLIDDIGAFGLSDYTSNWIIDNALDEEWFNDAMRESYESYADDIKNESASNDDMYVNRLHEEMDEHSVVEPLELPEEPQETDYDDRDDESGLPDMTRYDDDYEAWEKECDKLRDVKENEVENSIDEFVDKLCGGQSGVDWYRDNFGREELSEVAKSNNLVDEDAVAKMILDTDGRGHIISSWDGEEYSHGNYNIYRVG